MCGVIYSSVKCSNIFFFSILIVVRFLEVIGIFIIIFGIVLCRCFVFFIIFCVLWFMVWVNRMFLLLIVFCRCGSIFYMDFLLVVIMFGLVVILVMGNMCVRCLIFVMLVVFRYSFMMFFFIVLVYVVVGWW